MDRSSNQKDSADAESKAATTADYEQYFDLPDAEFGSEEWEHAIDEVMTRLGQDLGTSGIIVQDARAIVESLSRVRHLAATSDLTEEGEQGYAADYAEGYD